MSETCLDHLDGALEPTALSCLGPPAHPSAERASVRPRRRLGELEEHVLVDLDELDLGDALDRRVARLPPLEEAGLTKKVSRAESRHLLLSSAGTAARLDRNLALDEDVEAAHLITLLEDGIALMVPPPIRTLHHRFKLVKGDVALARRRRRALGRRGALTLSAARRRREHREHVIDVALTELEPNLAANTPQIVRRDVALILRVEDTPCGARHVEARGGGHAHALRDGDGALEARASAVGGRAALGRRGVRRRLGRRRRRRLCGGLA